MHCRSCSKEVVDTAEVCVHCGSKPTAGSKYCQHCGAETDPKAEVCVKCGVRLATAPVKPKEGKDWLVALLLSIFVGELGVDRSTWATSASASSSWSRPAAAVSGG
jgi:ribosomal protein L40E